MLTLAQGSNTNPAKAELLCLALSVPSFRPAGRQLMMRIDISSMQVLIISSTQLHPFQLFRPPLGMASDVNVKDFALRTRACDYEHRRWLVLQALHLV